MGRTGIRAATAVSAVAAALALSACGNDDGPTERTLRFTEGEGRPTVVVDTPPRTFSREEGSPGDTWIFSKPLRDESGRPAGNAYATCVAFSGGSNPKATCEGTIELEGGTLTFNEVFRVMDESRHAAITGGTGAFAGATGTFRGGGDLGNRDEIKLLLPRALSGQPGSSE